MSSQHCANYAMRRGTFRPEITEIPNQPLHCSVFNPLKHHTLAGIVFREHRERRIYLNLPQTQGLTRNASGASDLIPCEKPIVTNDLIFHRSQNQAFVNVRQGMSGFKQDIDIVGVCRVMTKARAEELFNGAAKSF